VQFANQLIGRKVPLMLGPSSVAGCRAVAPLVTNGPVAYGLSAAGPTPKGGYSFTAGYSTVDAVRTALSYFRERGWHKLAILDPTDATGQDGEAGLDADLAMPDNKVLTGVACEHFNNADLSVAAQVARIEATNPDVALAAERDVGLVVADALRHVGPNATAEQIRNYIEGLHGLSGAAATFDFRDGSQRVSRLGGKPLPRTP
jgi:ABC-type branched-subunit amino acid transport system substrate-binding protein